MFPHLRFPAASGVGVVVVQGGRCLTRGLGSLECGVSGVLGGVRGVEIAEGGWNEGDIVDVVERKGEVT